MAIQGILFDYGNTLISIELDWDRLIPANVANLVNYLQTKNFNLSIESFGKRFVELKKNHHQQGQLDMLERHARDTLRETLNEFNINSIPDPILDEAVDAYFSPEESEYPLVPQTHETLTHLKNQGYKMAVVSNASSGELIRKAILNRDLSQYFDAIIVSADIKYRKPHPRIFQTALKKINISPQNSVMIGDVPAYDIAGPNKLGIRTILVDYLQSTEAKERPSDIQPDAIAHRITDIPKIIQSWK